MTKICHPTITTRSCEKGKGPQSMVLYCGKYSFDIFLLRNSVGSHIWKIVQKIMNNIRAWPSYMCFPCLICLSSRDHDNHLRGSPNDILVGGFNLGPNV
ncbi:hypothetical protein QQ045_001363 [Rhodiola kirilowii]